jgi:ATP-dependent helicase/DNAse subunit B
MSETVELVVGPARSGKARRVLGAYREALASAEPGRCLMIVPTAVRRRATESRLLAESAGGVLVRPGVLTLDEVAERLLTDAGQPVRRVTPLARLSVIRECLDGLGPRPAAVLGRARGTPGLVAALDALFYELKVARVDPDAFGRALGAAGLASPRNRALAVLYDAYQKTILGRGLYDDAGRFWHAAALVADGRLGTFDRLAILVVDGFTDFAPAQLDVIQGLADRAARTLVTLTCEAGAERRDLFGPTERTRQRLRERFGKRLREVPADDPAALPPDLARLGRRLFAPPSGAARPEAQGAIRVIRAAGRTREVEEVARQVADLLRPAGADRDGAAAAPARNGSRLRTTIGVLARSLDDYGPLVREVFPRYGLPFRVDQRRALADCPVVRAAVALLRLQAEDYAYRALARVLKSNYFRPEAFGADPGVARAAVAFAREANVWQGRASYARGFAYLEGVARRAGQAVDESGDFALDPQEAERRIERLGRARALLDALFAALDLPERATRAAFAERVAAIVRGAGLWEAVLDDPDRARQARDGKALQAFDEVLGEVALLARDGRAETSRGAFLAELEQGLGQARIPAEEPADAPVVVMGVEEGRALGFDHVFLLGLAEKEFPRRGRRHPFFDDAERADLARRGVALPDSAHAAEEEMLLFYLAVTRAGRSLTLAYPSLDAQGRPALASHYLDEVEGLFAPRPEGGALPLAEAGTRDLDLAAERLRSDRELLAATMFSLWKPGGAAHPRDDLAVLNALLGRPRDAEAAAPGRPATPVLTGQAAETALAGLAVEWEREHGDAFGPFDGVLGAADLADQFSRRFPAEETTSAGRLDAFGTCPFAFFARHLLDLKPAKEPSPDLGPLDVGLIYHGLLERFFTALAAKPFEGLLAAENRDAACDLLERTAAAYFEHLEKDGRIGSAALWRIQRRNILRDLTHLVDWHVAKLGGWRAAHCEVPFGPAGRGPARPPGRREAIAIAGPHGPVRIAGRIDRIDREAEGDGLQVIDYKSGGAPTRKAMAAGTSFQLPVYLWALAELLGVALDSRRVEAFFLPIRSPARSGRLWNRDAKGNAVDGMDRALERAATYIHRFIDAMRGGRFPVYPRAACPGHCDFDGICRYAEWRIRRKWDAHPIAELEEIGDDAGGDQDEEADR